MTNWRAVELLDFAAMYGITLPLPAETIIELEDAGHVVDLKTGEVSYGAADNERFSLTVIGEATAVVLNAEGEAEEEN